VSFRPICLCEEHKRRRKRERNSLSKCMNNQLPYTLKYKGKSERDGNITVLHNLGRLLCSEALICVEIYSMHLRLARDFRRN
jgi:hypothetical protein